MGYLLKLSTGVPGMYGDALSDWNLESLNATEVAKMVHLYARVGVGPIVPPGTPTSTDEYWADLTLVFPDLPRQIVSGHQRITANVSGLLDEIMHWALLHSAELSIDDVAKLLISFRRARQESASYMLLHCFAPQIKRRLSLGDVDVETLCMLAIAYRNEVKVPGSVDFYPEWDDAFHIRRMVYVGLLPFLGVDTASTHPLIVSSAEFALFRYRYDIIPKVVQVRATEFGYLSCRHMAKLIAIVIRHGSMDHFCFVRDVIMEMMTVKLWARENLADLVDALVTLAESGVNAPVLYDVFTMVLFRDVGCIDPVSTSRIVYAYALVDLPRYAIGLLPLLVNVTFDGLSPHMITNLNSWRMAMPDEENDDIMADYPGALADLFNRCFHWVRGQPPMDAKDANRSMLPWISGPVLSYRMQFASVSRLHVNARSPQRLDIGIASLLLPGVCLTFSGVLKSVHVVQVLRIENVLHRHRAGPTAVLKTHIRVLPSAPKLVPVLAIMGLLNGGRPPSALLPEPSSCKSSKTQTAVSIDVLLRLMPTAFLLLLISAAAAEPVPRAEPERPPARIDADGLYGRRFPIS
ncbi:unnamed protein product (mitochondrion) [Plasmodiophora brassicae]|uniref:Uncharacterized protein n=1 Tax=Plasmodiophora brassicae TaxID=37360 RepID=A0A3P3YMD5_PLABS|nr:unnamed protein product [Plasmodiophora brassicae]